MTLTFKKSFSDCKYTSVILFSKSESEKYMYDYLIDYLSWW